LTVKLLFELFSVYAFGFQNWLPLFGETSEDKVKGMAIKSLNQGIRQLNYTADIS